MKKMVFLSLISLVSLPLHAEESVMEVVPLSSRPAEEMVPLLLPLLEESERIVASGSRLIVKSTPARLAEIKALIKKLDVGLANLEISVVQGVDLTAEDLNAHLRLKLHIPPDHPSDADVRLRGRYYSSQIDETLNHAQHVRTLEGESAAIEIGRYIPYGYISGHGGHLAHPFFPGIDFIEATTGFYVAPRLAGEDQVILEIAPWGDRASRLGDGAIETRGVQTTVKAVLGEWVEIGASHEIARFDESGIPSKRYGTHSERLRIFIKAEKLGR